MGTETPQAGEPFADDLARFDRLVRTLRERCPWDREQTHATLRRHLLEEAYETLEVLDSIAALDSSPDGSGAGVSVGEGRGGEGRGGGGSRSLEDSPDGSVVGRHLDERPRSRRRLAAAPGEDSPDGSVVGGHLDESLCEELGDLLYQVWFHARLASERGAFTIADVARRVHDKLEARHPHVFGDVEARDADAVRANWDVIKQAEKGRASTMDGIGATLPALLRAVKVLKRAAAAGLVEQAPARAAFDEAAARLADLRAEPSERLLGDLLWAVVGLGRRLSIDPEDALRSATERAEHSYRLAEQSRR